MKFYDNCSFGLKFVCDFEENSICAYKQRVLQIKIYLRAIKVSISACLKEMHNIQCERRNYDKHIKALKRLNYCDLQND